MGDKRIAQALISDEEFHALVKEEVSRTETRVQGEKAIAPNLLIALVAVEEEGERRFPLVGVHFTEFDERRFELLEALGAEMRKKGFQVLCTILTSEAWVRSFTPEEYRARGHREVRSYEDKEEVVFVAGRTIDGRSEVVVRPIERGEDATIQGLGEAKDMQGAQSALLDGFFRGYLAEAARHD